MNEIVSSLHIGAETDGERSLAHRRVNPTRRSSPLERKQQSDVAQGTPANAGSQMSFMPSTATAKPEGICAYQ